MKNKALILCFALLALTFSCEQQSQAEVKMVSPEEMQSLLEMDDVQLVDVRTPEEYEDGYIEQSQNIDFRSPTFDDDIKKLDKSKPVILYCKSGGRSAKCGEKLIKAGFEKIYDLEGGITHWKFKGKAIQIQD
ncbi:MAG: rhodanese-like domain-containing protein [Algicola sp.]|nr:rhodanese-like domain-containing protein [Algicola sp.]